MGLHVERGVLVLLFHRAHVCRHLQREEPRRLCGTRQDVEQRLVLHAEADEDRVRARLELRDYGWLRHGEDDDHGLPLHLLPGVEDGLQIARVRGGDALAPVGAVRERFQRIPAGNAHGTGVRGRVRAVLKTDRQVPVAARRHIGPVISCGHAEESGPPRIGDDHERDIRRVGIVGHGEVLLRDLERERDLVAGRNDIAEEVNLGHVALRDVDDGTACQRQDAAPVLEQHQ